MIEQSTQHRITAHYCQRRWLIRILKPQRNDIAQALIGSLPVVVMFNLREYVANILFSQQNQVVQRLPCLSDKPLGVGIAHR